MASGSPTSKLPDLSVPRHIAIIMDGNGRWARERGLARIRGHEEGAESVRAILRSCGEFGVQYLTLYAFSTENWKRPKAEVAALMKLLERFLRKETPELMEQNVRLQAIGRLTDLPKSCQEELHRVICLTGNNTGVTLVLALSYSGRTEIIDAVRSIAQSVRQGHLDEAMIDPEVFSKHLYTRCYPDPDLLVRTSGEMRISNFLLWQLSYTEIYVTKKLWPDFRKPDLLAAIEDYSKRQRRYGGLGE
ncbi:MAG TPA: isoprenyl transferase [Chthoniobacteraceae bacterium]|jgi:undecaprenyl diphosphate synthase|nr:isoprenyl transferase [Chthoniobacteraceae bacterium]